MTECVYFSHSFSGCDHGDDVGVICPPGKLPTGKLPSNLLLFPLQQSVMMEMSGYY